MAPKLRSRAQTQTQTQTALYPRNEIPLSPNRQLTDMCEHFKSFIDEKQSSMQLKIDCAVDYRRKNRELTDKIKEWQQIKLNEVYSKFDFDVGLRNSYANESDYESSLKNYENQLKTELNAIEFGLSQKQLKKRKLTNKFHKLNRKIEKLEKNRTDFETNQIISDEKRNELKTLSNLMSVKYNVSNDNKKVAFYRTDCKRQRLLISFDGYDTTSKTTERISDRFWAQINKVCDI